jgi:hypothetical protein
MTRYHKIVINGEKQYRALNEVTGTYEDEILSEEDLIEQLLEDAIEEVIEIDKGQVERAICCLPSSSQREMVRNYIDYLERIAESFE